MTNPEETGHVSVAQVVAHQRLFDRVGSGAGDRTFTRGSTSGCCVTRAVVADVWAWCPGGAGFLPGGVLQAGARTNHLSANGFLGTGTVATGRGPRPGGWRD